MHASFNLGDLITEVAFSHPGEDDLELLVGILTKSTVTEHPEPSFHGLMEPKPVNRITCDVHVLCFIQCNFLFFFDRSLILNMKLMVEGWHC